MSSPFQQKFSKKNPVKTFTLKQLERQAKKDDKEMYKNSALLPQINQGDYDYESEDEQEFPGDDRFTYEKKTQVNSPLNSYRSGSGGMAYVSTAGHFQRLQDNIARAFTPTKGNKADYDATEENKKYLEAEEQTAASKVITGDGFGNRSGSKPIAIEDIDVYDESDLEFDNY
jgi:hypothetical protein